MKEKPRHLEPATMSQPLPPSPAEASSQKQGRPLKSSPCLGRRHRRFVPFAAAAALAMTAAGCFGSRAASARPRPRPVKTAAPKAHKSDPLILAIARAVADKDIRVRMEAVHALRRMGAEALPLLLTALRSPDPVVRSQAASALGRIESPQALRALARLVKDPDVRVRMEAIHALGRMGPKAVRQLIEATRSADPLIRAQAVGSLGRLKSLSRRQRGSRERASSKTRARAAGPKVEVRATLTLQEMPMPGQARPPVLRRVKVRATLTLDPKVLRTLLAPLAPAAARMRRKPAG